MKEYVLKNKIYEFCILLLNVFITEKYEAKDVTKIIEIFTEICEFNIGNF